ncbi:MAG: carbamoyltransferase family protein, partial [Alphaproteobacteria bacterium]
MVAILGISAFYHDSAAALIVDGNIIAAAQEERFSRKKHDAGYPRQAIDYVLSAGKLALDDVDFVAFYDKPFLKFERLLETYLAFAPRGFSSFRMAMPIWVSDKLFLKDLLAKNLRGHSGSPIDKHKLLFAEHHVSHAASAFYPSPFERAAVLTVDGVGEWATTTTGYGDGRDLQITQEILFPHSLGLLYSAFTFYTGFRVNSGEYKVMGLAPYGVPRFRDLILDRLVDLKEDGSFHLDQAYFDYCTGLTMTNQRFAELFGEPARNPETDPLTPFHMDVAASVQAVTEEIMLKITRALARASGATNLCLAGGVALNCVANGKILRDGAFKKLWVQPAAGDAGGAIGAALAAWHGELERDRTVRSPDAMNGALLGPSFSQDEVEKRLDACGAVFVTVSDDAAIAQTAEALAEGKAVGWFQDRMEFGPRALGARSIIADPRSSTMQKTLNLKVKFRESFRPFAPSILAEDAADWFEIDRDSPYMMVTADVREHLRLEPSPEDQALFGIDRLNVKRSSIPAV